MECRATIDMGGFLLGRALWEVRRHGHGRLAAETATLFQRMTDSLSGAVAMAVESAAFGRVADGDALRRGHPMCDSHLFQQGGGNQIGGGGGGGASPSWRAPEEEGDTVMQRIVRCLVARPGTPPSRSPPSSPSPSCSSSHGGGGGGSARGGGCGPPPPPFLGGSSSWEAPTSQEPEEAPCSLQQWPGPAPRSPLQRLGPARPVPSAATWQQASTGGSPCGSPFAASSSSSATGGGGTCGAGSPLVAARPGVVAAASPAAGAPPPAVASSHCQPSTAVRTVCQALPSLAASSSIMGDGSVHSWTTADTAAGLGSEGERGLCRSWLAPARASPTRGGR